MFSSAIIDAMTRTEKQRKILQPVMDWEAKYQKPWPPPVKAVVDKGCRSIPLGEFLRLAANSDWYDGRRNREIGALKKALSSPADRLKTIADELYKLADDPVWVTAADMSEGKSTTAEFLHYGADGLRVYAAGLEKRCADIAELWSSRRTNYLVPLCLYCKQASHGKVTVREIADLLNWAGALKWDEHNVSVRLSGQRKEPYYKYISNLMDQYIAACPDGQLTFGEWSREQRNRAIERENKCTV